jgi:hypothetical protein
LARHKCEYPQVDLVNLHRDGGVKQLPKTGNGSEFSAASCSTTLLP